MASFKILVGKYSIIATNGASGGRQPVGKSDAVSFDVIDRRSQGNTQFAARDQTFSEAWDFCAHRLLVTAASRPH
ncbi:hypothetical protein R75461_07407 [Paraburkholderia nemoris]|uniref:hypothetical protein n=1 Tax=Paraburkholderia nemoris TaxID=2793076 RepID=UPI00190AA918|nr:MULTISPECIES: hypothetical protein [Paraburkholderia]MBK3786247.1 hypothetical protein [Paraburkholderia aspalathi]CAE6849590.1 hypothetical protein R75461_07407 [Paraburkholderia nemoris]